MAADIVPSGIGFFANDWSLQLDNATSHTSAQAQQDLLDSGVPNILFQPPCSPDMNPIENVWALLKKRIIPHRCENADQLVQALHLELEWDSLGPDTVSPYVESMPRRVEALIEADGGHTKY
eukprot:scpid12702/ scgid26386/ Transposable element Tcb1 transposase; Transposable element Barney transposase